MDDRDRLVARAVGVLLAVADVMDGDDPTQLTEADLRTWHVALHAMRTKAIREIADRLRMAFDVVPHPPHGPHMDDWPLQGP